MKTQSIIQTNASESMEVLPLTTPNPLEPGLEKREREFLFDFRRSDSSLLGLNVEETKCGADDCPICKATLKDWCGTMRCWTCGWPSQPVEFCMPVEAPDDSNIRLAKIVESGPAHILTIFIGGGLTALVLSPIRENVDACAILTGVIGFPLVFILQLFRESLAIDLRSKSQRQAAQADSSNQEERVVPLSPSAVARRLELERLNNFQASQVL
jgi:hypothetical protein